MARRPWACPGPHFADSPRAAPTTSTPDIYPDRLDPEQRRAPEEIARNGRAPVKEVRHAQVLLPSDRGRPGGKMPAGRIAEALGMHLDTVARVRNLFATGGAVPALERKVREAPPVAPEVDGRIEAHLIALCTGPPPEGRARWTMELLAGERRPAASWSTRSPARRPAWRRKKRAQALAEAIPVRAGATTPDSSPTWSGCSTPTTPGTTRSVP